jgi:ribosomal protein S27AE
MFESHVFDPTNPPPAKLRCPKCGVSMFLSQIDPTDKADHDERTYECAECDYFEKMVVQFR